MVVNCGMQMETALALKTPFRGAIEIGVAARFPQADLYGPALAKVHDLESKVAQYPRIIVGPTLIDYLNAQVRKPENDLPSRVNRGLAKLCLSLLSEDADGLWIIDYLGQAFTDLGRQEGWQEIRKMAFSFVLGEFERFRREDPDKLGKRYERLVAYYCSRGFSVPQIKGAIEGISAG